ncbi:PREDICTED: cuticle protein 16.5-like [Rhagoletis zephyria]|uniref:cuticle protein 16.5-like n=1 Tax=Rhagoletis zephyria TaxID=28612 RepID=UPI0008118C77|nr:PREDICTED: cuticle protein 16.5-like [Rhagoletis zephyria]
MALKVIFVIAAVIACAHARPGGPAAYSISAPSVDHASVGNTQEHTVKGHYGQSSQSDYSSAVQTAHSQSHVQRSSISNDAGIAPHIGGHVVAAAAPVAHAYAAPVAAYAAHGYAAHGYTAPAATYAAHGYTAPAATLSHSCPALSHGIAYAAPASYHAPAISYQTAHAPALHYAASAPAYGHYAAPAALAHSYVAAAPAASVKYASAPAYVSHGLIGHPGIPLAAPALAHYPAPLAVKAVAAPALVHTSVAGHGVHYGY